MKAVVFLSPYMPSESFCFQNEGSCSMVLKETGHKRVNRIHAVTGYFKDVTGLPDATDVRQILD